MNTRIITLSLILSLVVGFLPAQEKYTVQVGAFLNVKPQDFDAIRSLGFVYANQLDNNLHQVYIGGYTSSKAASGVESRLRNQGYANAQMVALPLNQGTPITMIQIATRLAKKTIEWEKFEQLGELFVVLEDDKVKILTGVYTNTDAAKTALPAIRKAGYSDAFVKNVNSKELIPVGHFETGIKKPLIPLTFNNQPPPSQTQPQPQPQPSSNAPVIINQPPRVTGQPSSYGNVEGTRILTPRSPRQPEINEEPKVVRNAPVSQDLALPSIRAKVKRRSAMDLQTILKQKGYYTSSIDGYYGNGTTRAYQSAIREDVDLKKYQLLANNMSLPSEDGTSNRLQAAINNLWQDPNAPVVVESSTGPIALAYQAYLLFYNFGPSNEVNTKMNQAIKTAYQDAKRRDANFDFKATYAYQDLGQLIQHLHYIHSAPENDYSLPCWLYQVHSKETAAARVALGDAEVKMQACDPFQQWEEIRLLQTIAYEMCASHQVDNKQVSTAAAARAQLYLIDKPLNKEDAKVANTWHQETWDNINSWARQDPLHQRLSDALKISYFQSQVRLEDYFMDQGFKAAEAKQLALATLHTLVSLPLERFS